MISEVGKKKKSELITKLIIKVKNQSHLYKLLLIKLHFLLCFFFLFPFDGFTPHIQV